MELVFSGEVIFWRGPSPFHFVPGPDAQSEEIRSVSKFVTYGWGAIPVTVVVGDTEWTTSLFPKDDRYLVPVKDRVRRAEGIELGDLVDLRLTLADGSTGTSRSPRASRTPRSRQ